MLQMLVVDDEPRHVEGMLRLLQRLCPDADIKGAYSGEEALRCMDERQPDILFTDIRMEDMDGLALLERIPEKKRKAMKIVIMSAYDLFVYAQQAMRLGAVDYLLKPVDEEELCRLLTVFCGENVAERDDKANDDTIQYVISYIKEHMSEDISLESMAEKCHYNPNYLSALFKQNTGVSYSAYLRKIRMERAVDLLMKSDANIDKIAAALGYRTTGYFIRTFRAEYGVPPGRYRRREGRT